MSPYDLYTVRGTDLSDEVPHTGANPSGEYRFLVFRRPYEMIFEVKDRVRALTVQLHVPILAFLKGSPEGEGFAPKDGYKEWHKNTVAYATVFLCPLLPIHQPPAVHIQ